jgi:hypothetical protein
VLVASLADRAPQVVLQVPQLRVGQPPALSFRMVDERSGLIDAQDLRTALGQRARQATVAARSIENAAPRMKIK